MGNALRTCQKVTAEDRGEVDLHAELYEVEQKLYRAYDQVILLKKKRRDVERRMALAQHRQQISYGNTLRFRGQVIQGILNTYLEYACVKREEMVRLRLKMFGEEE